VKGDKTCPRCGSPASVPGFFNVLQTGDIFRPRLRTGLRFGFRFWNIPRTAIPMSGISRACWACGLTWNQLDKRLLADFLAREEQFLDIDEGSDPELA